MISSLFYDLNHSPLWQREVGVWNRKMRAASLDRLVFLYLHRFGWMGAPEDRLLRRLVEPGMVIIDVGANIGLYSLLLAGLAGETGRVYSFEPEPNLFRTFAANCEANHASNVVPLQRAAGASNGRMSFTRSAFNSGNNNLGASGEGGVEVEVVRIDDALAIPCVDFIKIDVQGYELAALSGMERLLASNPTVRVLFEFWPAGLRGAGTEPHALLAFLSERGFTIYSTDEPGLPELNDVAALVEKLGAKAYTNLIASRTGVPA
jgi:FkbM family methyltransferase